MLEWECSESDAVIQIWTENDHRYKAHIVPLGDGYPNRSEVALIYIYIYQLFFLSEAREEKEVQVKEENTLTHTQK